MTDGYKHLILRRVILGAAVFLLFALLAIAGTWPLLSHLSTHITDHFGDGALHMWNTWWVGQALARGQSPFFTDAIFYPNGVSLVTQNFAWFHILPSLLLEPFTNDIAAFNIAVLLNLVLCGVVAFWVMLQLCGDARAALLGGAIYMLWPYRIDRLDLPNTLATYWIPLFLLFLLYSVQRRQWRYAVLAGLFCALVGYGRWQFLIPAVILGLILFLFSIAAQPREERRRALTIVGAAGLVALLLLAPAAGLLLGGDVSRDDLEQGGDEELLMSADLLAFGTPSQLHAVVGDYTAPLYDRFYSDREALRRRPAYIGLLPLVLAVLGIFYQRRRALPWVIMALVMMLLALGPAWRINGHIYEGIPTLYRLLSQGGILSLIRNPERFVMFVALPVAVLSAWGWSGLLEDFVNNKGAAWLMTAAAILFIYAEFFAPQTVLRDRGTPPLIYEELAVEEGEFALLNLPFDNLKARNYMGDQLLHGRAIVQGNLSRVPESADRFVDDNAFLSTLDVTGEMAPQFPDISRQLGDLSAVGVRYLLLHKDKVGADRIAHWGRALAVRPWYEDEQIVAYRTAPQAGRDFDIPEGWGNGPAPVRTSLSTACAHPGRPLVASIAWGTSGPVQQDLDVLLALAGEDGEIGSSAQFQLVKGWPSGSWPANTLAWGHYQLNPPPDLAAGRYQLSATLLESPGGTPRSTSMPLGEIEVQNSTCDLTAGLDGKPANVLFGDELRLAAYTAEQNDNQLNLHLFWRAERFIDREYTIFVHVFDPDTAVPVAQDDGRPRDGAYLMEHWWPGEVVDDRVTVNLEGVPAGQYGVAIGVYDASTGERLPIVRPDGELEVADGRYVLSQKVIAR
jgi:hypothetical protein